MKICYNKNTIIVLLVMYVFLTSCSIHTKNANSKMQLVDYVDPYIGSGGHGHVFVGANVPFGAVQVGPNNIFKGWDWCSGYHYSDSLIIGFSQLHLSGTGIGDLGDVLIMPYTGDVKIDKGRQEYPHNGYLSTFSHENEIAKPGYYSVTMDNGVKVELTSSERVGYHRYIFPENKEGHIIIDLSEGIDDHSTKTSLKKIDDYTLVGTRFSSGWAKEQEVYFAVKSSVPILNFQIFDKDKLCEGNIVEEGSVKGLVNFVETPKIVEWKVGISPVSTDNALNNIDAEIPGWDFDSVVELAQKKWNKELKKITIETKKESYKRIFYTSVYHSYIHPSLFNDHNGDYRASKNQIFKHAEFNNYSIFSLWDTYRAAHPLYAITQPERVNDFINSMLAIYDQQGYLPIWHLNGYETGTMVGISSIQVIAEAYLKGYRGFDVDKAYEAIIKTAMSDLRGMNYLKELKPIPSDDNNVRRAVAQAMEISISDGSIALMAKALGKTSNYEYFTKRSNNYKLFFEKEIGFFHGIKKDGTWNRPFDPIISKHHQATDYAEGNAWQYLWLVPHDVEGLVQLLGGKDNFNARLDSFFTLNTKDKSEVLVDLTGLIGQYAHGNEPSHHISYLYSYTGKQSKTSEKVRYIMKEFYHDNPDGVIGNEDCGQMSAWYIFSSLGFYPVFPASLEYQFGSPLFDKAEIQLEDGKRFIIEVENNSDENIYIQSIELNGKKYKHNFIKHEDIIAGGSLKFVMGPEVNEAFEKLSNRINGK